MQLGGLEAVHVTPEKKRKAPPVLLLHGLGLGAWIWEAHQAALAEEGIESYAVDLPGHGADAGSDVSFEEVVRAARRAAETLGTPAVMGQGFGTLVAQELATRVPLASLVLVSPLPPAGVAFWPTAEGVKSLAPRLPALLMGRPLSLDGSPLATAGLETLREGQAAAIAERITPLAPQLVRVATLDRPEIPRDGIDCPVLVTFGLNDKAVRMSTIRLIGDYYNAMTWRFDDLGHLPPLEAGAERHARKVAGWLRRPKSRRLDEIDAFAPGEGVGQDVREQRRGFRRRRTKLDEHGKPT